MNLPKILIIDDSKFMRTVLKKLLLELEYVEVVGDLSNANEALELIDKNNIDIVICDFSLPEMNGLELTKKILEKNSNIKVILTSINRYLDQVQEGLNFGVKDIIKKPFHPDKTLEKIITVIMS